MVAAAVPTLMLVALIIWSVWTARDEPLAEAGAIGPKRATKLSSVGQALLVRRSHQQTFALEHEYELLFCTPPIILCSMTAAALR